MVPSLESFQGMLQNHLDLKIEEGICYNYFSEVLLLGCN